MHKAFCVKKKNIFCLPYVRRIADVNGVLLPGPYNGFPRRVMGMYILLADDTEKG